MTFLTAMLMVSSILVSTTVSSPLPVDSAPGGMMSQMLNMIGGMYSMMIQNLIDLKLSDNLSSTTPGMTLFLLPNDMHRAVMMTDMGKMMTSNPDHLKKFMSRHMVMQKLTPSDIQNDMIVTSLSGEKIRFNIYGSGNNKVMTANGRMITMETQTMFPNCVVYRLRNSIMSIMGPNVMDVLNMKKDRFSSLIQAIQVAGLESTLQTGGPFTVFAPTNDAFKMVPPEMMAKLMASPADMKKLLLGHVTSGVNTLPGLMIINGDLPSMDGGSNKIMTTGNTVTVDGVNLVAEMGMTNMFAENGVIIAIDRVLPA